MQKEPNAVDRHVGARVRMCRLRKGLSQSDLGAELGVTFQQVQKYEKGTNRIGASRLHTIATVLGVPVAFLFDGSAERSIHSQPDAMSDFMSSSDGIALVSAFLRLPEGKQRKNIVHIVEQIAEGHSEMAARQVA